MAKQNWRLEVVQFEPELKNNNNNCILNVFNELLLNVLLNMQNEFSLWLYTNYYFYTCTRMSIWP